MSALVPAFVLSELKTAFIIGFVIFAAAFVVIANIIVDLAYSLLDPRVRIS